MNPYSSKIVRLFYDLARTHERLRSFIYDQSREKGFGNELHPLLWLDDPIYGRNGSGNAYVWTVNFDILGIPDDDIDAEHIQARADVIALELIEKIKRTRFEGLAHGFTVTSVQSITLREYYDNDAAGMRYTVELTGPYAGNRCTDPFNPDKEFENPDTLPDIDVDDATGCAVFANKTDVLPSFDFAKK